MRGLNECLGIFFVAERMPSWLFGAGRITLFKSKTSREDIKYVSILRRRGNSHIPEGVLVYSGFANLHFWTELSSDSFSFTRATLIVSMLFVPYSQIIFAHDSSYNFFLLLLSGFYKRERMSRPCVKLSKI